MEDVQDFTVKQDFNRRALLAEAIEVVRYSDDLGAERISKGIEYARSRAIELLQKLDEEQANFSPKLDVRHLTGRDFEELGIEPSRALKAKMRQNDFFQVGIPITLFPRSGWAFTRLECFVNFCSNSGKVRDCPTVHDIFPEDVWIEIFDFQDHLELGLDEDLTFRAQVANIEGKWKSLTGAAKAKLAMRTGAGAQLVVGPFSYQVRRAQVRTRGRGNISSFWRLDSKAHVDEEDVRLGVVLMVPKARSQPVDVKGELKAYHDFQFWSADLWKDWWHYFDDAIKNLFQGGVVVTDTMVWQNITRPDD
jgi:hypothetical protein